MQLSVLPRTRWRRQVGQTNRCQRSHLLGSDLLGQAQASRAVRNGINISLRRIRAADCPQRVHEDPSPPRLTLPTDTSGPTGPGRCTPGDQRQSGPEDMFYLVSRRVFHNNKPDVVLECMGSQWEFQCPHFTKSGTLANLHMAARQQRVMLQQDSTGSNKSARNRALIQPSISGVSRDSQKGGKPTGSLTLQLPVKHHTVTKDALSVTPRTLYIPEACLDRWEETLVSAASLLGLPHLFKRCLTEMIDKICCSTVCDFHHVSCRYKEISLQKACERWLELHLVTELSCFICLRDLPFDVLHKTLRSPRVFAGCEYDLLKTVLYWVFLQFNPDAQIMPSHRTIISFFSSWTGVFLEQPKGHKFIVLFQAVRLHGITERRHLEELQMIRVFPQAWLLRMFSKHYYTLHSGGDIQVTDFSHQAVRFGMVVEKEPQYCTQIIELYGFYFLLKAACSVDTDTHGFSLQRLRHSEPAMSVQACERHPFSMMSVRLVTYQINVQAKVRGQWQEFCSGPINKEFGLNKDTCKSQVFTVKRLNMPIFVTFALAFQAH